MAEKTRRPETISVRVDGYQAVTYGYGEGDEG